MQVQCDFHDTVGAASKGVSGIMSAVHSTLIAKTNPELRGRIISSKTGAFYNRRLCRLWRFSAHAHRHRYMQRMIGHCEPAFLSAAAVVQRAIASTCHAPKREAVRTAPAPALLFGGELPGSTAGLCAKTDASARSAFRAVVVLYLWDLEVHRGLASALYTPKHTP